MNDAPDTMRNGRARLPKRRSVRVLVSVIVGLVVAYPVAANLFLAADSVQKMFEGDSIQVHFRRAWSFWPGRVHVEDIRVTVQDRNVQFVLDLPNADLTVRLRDLVHRRFHVTRLRGSGLVYRFRHRIDPESVDLPFVRALPPIPGFADPPLREAGPPEPPIDDAHYKLWTVHIEDVDVEVREVWSQMFRFQGTARAIGAFRLKPARRVWVGPAELRVEKGTLTTGPYEAASAIEGTIDCKVDDFDTEHIFGWEPFRFISARARLNLQVPGLDAVNFLAAPGGEVELEDGSGELAMNVAIDHGVMTSDTWLAYRTGHLGVATPFAKFRLDGELGVSAFGPRESGPPEVIVAIPTATLSFDGARHPPIVIHDTGGALATSNVDVTQPWSFAGASANVAATISDLRSVHDVSSMASRNISVRSGRADAQARVVFSADRAMRGSLEARAQSVKLCQKDCICAETPRVSLSASATSAAPRHAPEASFRLDKRPIDAHVRGTIDRPSFRWGSFQFAGARTSFATAWDGSLASSFIRMTSLKLVSSGGAPKGWQANIGSVSLRSDLRASSDGVGGPLWLDVGGIDARVGKTRLEGSASARLELSSTDPSHRTGDLSGVVQARRVAVHAGNQEVRDWWADLALRRLHVDTRENVDFTGTVGARFRDALPALDALASEDQVPGWVPKAFPLRSLAVDLDVERFCKFTDVQLVDASGGPLKASGRLQFEPGETRGALLFELAAFHPASLGLDFVEDYSDTKVFAGSRWLEEHMEPLTKAAREKHDTRCVPEPTICE